MPKIKEEMETNKEKVKDKNAFAMNTTILAFMGDSIYDSHIRAYVISTGEVKAHTLHKETVKYVRAEAQALALSTIFESLTLEEKALVKRARNKKITSKPKNADPVMYKRATAFEALIGALYLSRDDERLQEILAKAIDAIRVEL